MSGFILNSSHGSRIDDLSVRHLTSNNITVKGDIMLERADLAEEFVIISPEPIEPGTVMVIKEGGALGPSTKPYDKTVAGVVTGPSDQGPAIILGRCDSGDSTMPLALTGKVLCKIDAQYGAVEVGDLLTTSATPGHAMRASDCARAFGAVIGKALGRLDTGSGLVPVLVALQ